MACDSNWMIWTSFQNPTSFRKSPKIPAKNPQKSPQILQNPPKSSKNHPKSSKHHPKSPNKSQKSSARGIHPNSSARSAGRKVSERLSAGGVLEVCAANRAFAARCKGGEVVTRRDPKGGWWMKR